MRYWLLFLLLLVTGALLADGVNLVSNGKMIDVDGNSLPDYWTGIDLVDGDQVECGGKRCWWQFAGNADHERRLEQTLLLDVPEKRAMKIKAYIKGIDIPDGSQLAIDFYKAGDFKQRVSIWLTGDLNQKRIAWFSTGVGADRLVVRLIHPGSGNGYRVTGVRIKL